MPTSSAAWRNSHRNSSCVIGNALAKALVGCVERTGRLAEDEAEGETEVEAVGAAEKAVVVAVVAALEV